MNKSITLKIDSLTLEGKGVATIEGIKTFIEGGLPEEIIECEITRKHKNYQEGKLVKILTHSLFRTLPACEFYNVCGGCSLQHLDTDHQVNYKQLNLLDQLTLFGKIKPESILPPLKNTSDWGYRRKARLGVKFVRKKGRVLVGFREKKTNYIADIHSCKILHPAVGERLDLLSKLIETLSQPESIPQIEVAIGDSERGLVFRHMEDLSSSDLEKLIHFGEENKFSIYLQPNPPGEVIKLFPHSTDLLLSYSIQVQGKLFHFKFHPLEFIQVNSNINQALVELAIRLLEPTSNDVILDLFCGIGNFTLPIGMLAKEVVGVEGSKPMIELAKTNAYQNSIGNISFYASNLMATEFNFPWLNKKYDKILLDPPRTGAKEILPHIAKLNAKKIVYVSCNPATFVRDATELVHQYGYTLKAIGTINMFPHTSHIETISLFEA